jgi:hypothetical protein
MRREFKKCLDREKISRFPSGPKLAEKELRSAFSAVTVLEKAEEFLEKAKNILGI